MPQAPSPGNGRREQQEFGAVLGTPHWHPEATVATSGVRRSSAPCACGAAGPGQGSQSPPCTSAAAGVEKLCQEPPVSPPVLLSVPARGCCPPSPALALPAPSASKFTPNTEGPTRSKLCFPSSPTSFSSALSLPSSPPPQVKPRSSCKARGANPAHAPGETPTEVGSFQGRETQQDRSSSAPSASSEGN